MEISEIREKVRAMSREEISSQLAKWFENKTLVTTEQLGIPTSEINKKVNKRILSLTPIVSILFRGDSDESLDYEIFKAMIDEKRVLSTLNAKIEKKLRSLHRLHVAAMDGTLLRLVFDGVILYID